MPRQPASVLTAALAGLVLLAGIGGGSAMSAQELLPPAAGPVAEGTDFSFVPIEGPSFQMNPAKLFGLDPNIGLAWFKQLFGDTYSYAVAMIDVAPLAQGFWPCRADGSRIPDSELAGEARTTWRMLQTGWNLTVYQGLLHDPARPLKLNIINLFAGYSGYWNLHYLDQTPDSYLFASNQADRAGWLAHILRFGVMFDDTDTNRLFNTKRGSAGQVQLEWAPRALGNDILGVSDFSRLSATLSHNLPLVGTKDFSAYLFQRTGFDLYWGDSQPLAAHYGQAGLAATGSGSIRGGVLPDGTMHLTSCLDIRGSFPTAFEAGIMPGFSVFWDCGLYDDRDYQLSFDRLASSIGANAVVHLDSATILPFSMILDLQLGVAYDLRRGLASFQFGMNLPQ
jgi:hypothetical protein